MNAKEILAQMIAYLDAMEASGRQPSAVRVTKDQYRVIHDHIAKREKRRGAGKADAESVKPTIRGIPIVPYEA